MLIGLLHRFAFDRQFVVWESRLSSSLLTLPIDCMERRPKSQDLASSVVALVNDISDGGHETVVTRHSLLDSWR